MQKIFYDFDEQQYNIQTQINPSTDNENLVNYSMKENMELKKVMMENYGRDERHEDKKYKHAYP